MDQILMIAMSAIVSCFFMIPVILALVLATFLAKLFSGIFTPVTRIIRNGAEAVFGGIPNPLEWISLPSEIKGRFGSAKNILFIGFVIIFLIFHYKTLGDVGNVFDNITLLFPGSALEQFTSYNIYDGKLDIASFLVKPELYLQTVIFSCINGLFMYLGCTTKDPDAEINFFVKLLYTMLITLFTSIVLSKFPPELFAVSFPKISLDSLSVTSVTDGPMVLALMTEMGKLGVTLLKKLVSIIPSLVAVYFLCQSISCFSASFLGGFIALFSLAFSMALVNPDGMIDTNSFRTVFFLLFALSAGEVVALFFSEFVDAAAEMWAKENIKIFVYYDIVSLLLAYFFYPALGVSLLCFISLFTDEFKFVMLLLGIGFLLIFSLAVFVGYKINRWTWDEGEHISGGEYATAMVFNIPIWITYLVLFAR